MSAQLDLLHVSHFPRVHGLLSRSPWVTYGATTAATLVAAGVSLVLFPRWLAGPMAPFMIAVIFAAWFGGLWPSLLATAMSICAVFLLPYPQGLYTPTPSGLIMFGVICLGIGTVAESLVRARRQAMEQAGALEEQAMEVEMANQELTEAAAEARQSRELAELAEQRYRLLFEQNPMPLWLYDLETLTFLAVNDAAVAHYGYTREEFLGMTLRDIRPPEDIPALLESYRKGSPGLASSGLFRHRTKNGTDIMVEIRSHDLRFGGRVARLVLATDVTEQVRARTELQSTNERLRVLVEASPLAIVGFDRDASVRSWNAAAERVFGWSESEVIGRPVPYVSAEQEEESQTIHKLIQSGNSITGFHAVRKRRDGTPIDVSVSWAPLRDAGGQVTGFVGVYEDITERRRTEKALQTSQEQLRQAQKMEAVGRLAGGVAHDFNNILTTIQSYAEFLATELGSHSPYIGDLKEIESAAVRASDLTRQLLAFSRKQPLDSQALDLNRMVGETERMLRRIIGEDIELVTRLDPQLGRFQGDPGQFSQVLLNLAVNARDAMPEGGRLLIETSNVELDEAYTHDHRGATPGPHILLSVSDTGVGMEAAVKERIFEPFFTTKESGKGTGLGLSMVYGIVQQSGGSIWVYSEPGEGTTFKIYLPRVAASSAVEPAEAGHTAHAPAPARAATILLVEDESAVRRVARRTLTEHGYTVLEAANGREALTVAEAHSGAIDLVLSDMVMPEMRGGELAGHLRKVRPEARMLMMSGYTEEAASRNAILDAGSAFLEKPFTASRLLERVQQVLEQA